ncbi:MAG: aquaporin [Lachnospiraceae bacterium]|nr:aquaporin [Lachnospiraceae bacterium]
MKKNIAEFIGTMTLVIMGCGTAMLVGCDSMSGCGYILTALAFGLSIVCMAYSIGNVSGCHINPAVSFAMWLKGDLSGKEFLSYVISQVLGALAGSLLLAVIFRAGSVNDMTGGMGTNGLVGVNGSIVAGLLVEIVLTFFFIITILGVTDERFKHGSFAGLIIALALVGVHIIGIGLTGTSVNPARSLGPAIVNAVFNKDTTALVNVWIFIIGPLAGSGLAVSLYRIISGE